MATYPIPAVGQRLTAEFVASMIPQTARKAAGTSRISTTTLTADPDLALPVEANAVYQFETLLLYDTAVAADFKWAFTVPVSTAGTYWISQVQTGSAGGGTFAIDDQNGSIAIASTPTAGGAGVGVQVAAMLYGSFAVAGTAGTLTLTWAQNTSTASNTTLQTGSMLKLTRIG